MVYHEFIRCEVCGSITRIRLQVGSLEEHPIVVTCGKCGVSLKGKCFIDQENVGLSMSFENAQRLVTSPATEEDYTVECSGEYTTQKMSAGCFLEQYPNTPFMRYVQKVGGIENNLRFANCIRTLNQTKSKWSEYNRVFQLFKNGNREYLVQELKKLYPEEFVTCRNELEVIRAVRMVEVQGFLAPLKPDIIKLPEIGTSIFKLDNEKLTDFISYLNSHDGYSLSQMQDQINKLLNQFIEVYPFLIPAISLKFCKDKNINFESEGTTTSTYSDVKQFYLDAYETLTNLLIIPVALDNIKYRNDINAFAKNDVGILSLDAFVGATKASRLHLYNKNEIYVRTLDVIYNQKLRNAIGHNDVEYDNTAQIITYIPNPKKRDKKNKDFLLHFEMEALSMFEGVLIISDYLYRLRELDLINNGEIPLAVDFFKTRSRVKIYPNEKCPCGSGMKYKKCHGKL